MLEPLGPPVPGLVRRLPWWRQPGRLPLWDPTWNTPELARAALGTPDWYRRGAPRIPRSLGGLGSEPGQEIVDYELGLLDQDLIGPCPRCCELVPPRHFRHVCPDGKAPLTEVAESAPEEQPAPPPPAPAPAPASESFAALDYEAADPKRDSACSLGVVRVENGKIVARGSWLIRPPRPPSSFHTAIHGLTWAQLRRERPFAEVWALAVPLLEGVQWLVAHGAAFDRSVTRACCAAANIAPPPMRWSCTSNLARKAWGLEVSRLDVVCRHLSIPLRGHHTADVDAEACAEVALTAQRQGHPLSLGAMR